MAKQLTPEELGALIDYAERHGRNWKSKLNEDWMYARTTGALQHIRNSFGPNWLVSFNLEKAKEQSQRMVSDEELARIGARAGKHMVEVPKARKAKPAAKEQITMFDDDEPTLF